jgi:hypothetical protein
MIVVSDYRGYRIEVEAVAVVSGCGACEFVVGTRRDHDDRNIGT